VLIVCAGTGTEVGKTWVGAQVLTRLRAAGLTVCARKPAQSFDPETKTKTKAKTKTNTNAKTRTNTDTDTPTDADVLAAATGESPSDVCPSHRSYPVAMAPPMAAAALGLAPPTIGELLTELQLPDPTPEVCWVESVGGVRSPLAIDADTVEACRRLTPALVVLVADAGLGTINLVRLSTAALADHRVVVMLNHYDEAAPLHLANRDWLAVTDGYEVVTTVAELAALIEGQVGGERPTNAE